MEVIEWEQGWEIMLTGITKLKRILEGLPETEFTSDDYMMLYQNVYTMCTQKQPHDYSQQLYDKYKETFEEHIHSTVLPSLREKHDEDLLREIVKRWSNHEVMMRWMSRFFHFLNRYFIPRRSLPDLNEVGLSCFRDLVYEEVKAEIQAAVAALFERLSYQESEREQIERALLENVRNMIAQVDKVRTLPFTCDNISN